MNLGGFLILISILTFVLAVITLWRTFHLRHLRAIRWLWALSSCFTIGPFCAVGVVIASSLEEKVLFFHLRILGMVFLLGFWLLFISAVFERWEWLHKKWVTALVLSPLALNFLLELIPATRGLVFSNFRLVTVYGLSLIQFDVGWLYWFFYGWAMFLLCLSVAISAVTFWQERGRRRVQALILNLGLAAALFHGVIADIFPQLRPADWLIVSSLSLFFNQAGVLYAVARHQLLSLVPLAVTRVFRRLPDPVLVLDDRGRLMEANDRAVAFFGLPALFHGRMAAEIMAFGKIEAGEQMVADAGNRAHPFHVVVEELGEGEKSPGRVVYFRDISVQKQKEQLLREGMEFRARLLAFLAHDLTGFLESQAVLATSVQERFREKPWPEIDLLAQSAYASQELVGNVMAWAKGQALKFSPDARSFEWNLLLRETLEQLSSRFRAKGVTFALKPAAAPLLASGDSEMLAAVFRNLLSNALRATRPGGEVTASLAVEGRWVTISVTDEGGGLREEEIQEILSGSREFNARGYAKAQGAGIGLMISRHFLHLHGGEFFLESELGVGTKATFRVPL